MLFTGLEHPPCLSLWERCPSALTGAERVQNYQRPSQSPPFGGASSPCGGAKGGYAADGACTAKQQFIFLFESI